MGNLNRRRAMGAARVAVRDDGGCLSRSWMILLRRSFARLLHYAAEIIEAERGGSLLGNGFVLPLINLLAPLLRVLIAGREGQSLVEINFSLLEVFKLKVSPPASCIGL